jgi:branched-subunit amino acid aminotransferase/4-amino-4-deoxychorismate lyase
VRITVSRGPVEGRGLTPVGLESATSTVVIQAWPFHPPSPGILGSGVAAITSTIRRDPASPLASVKSTSRADYVFAKFEAQAARADDALFLTPTGEVCEATSANVAILLQRRLATPPLSAGILAGTTRAWLIAEAPGLGHPIDERELRVEHLLAADEAFLCSSVAGIVPLTSLDGRPIGDGVPGLTTRAIRDARERWIDERSLAGSAGSGTSGRSTRR